MSQLFISLLHYTMQDVYQSTFHQGLNYICCFNTDHLLFSILLYNFGSIIRREYFCLKMIIIKSIITHKSQQFPEKLYRLP